jgi:hypothetical protein
MRKNKQIPYLAMVTPASHSLGSSLILGLG